MYKWKGMKKMTQKQAIEKFKKNELVYLLYDDNTESLVNCMSDIEDHKDMEFGIEIN